MPFAPVCPDYRLYDPGQIERNQQAYVSEGKVAASRSVERLLGPARRR